MEKTAALELYRCALAQEWGLQLCSRGAVRPMSLAMPGWSEPMVSCPRMLGSRLSSAGVPMNNAVVAIGKS